ncbi:MAG: TonB-dependent receptor [Bacteroidetes bacterium]|nr:MAG: TonB-dependent receptor [Bacteroidota bacterium]PTM11086.1 MAG: TonB-dependent receptor [Bacteroidota bacterium]
MTQTSTFVVKTTFAFLLLICLPLTLATAQTVITGTVIDDLTDEPLAGVEVRALSVFGATNAVGAFELRVGIPAGEALHLSVGIEGYQTYETDLVGNDSGQIDLGTIRLQAAVGLNQTILDELIPSISLADGDLDANGGGSQNISGVLSASRDVFVSAAAFTFGQARFNIRGYDARYTSVLINGLPVNDLETGNVFFNHWGGLNDVFRNRTNTIGLGASTFAYGGVGGASTVDTRASTQRKGLNVSYALSNRTYRNRVMATYNTGMLASGWAFSASASRRWADEGYVAGTFYDAYSYFLSVDRQLAKNNVLNLTVYGAPIKRGKISGATQETYDLAGTNFYNANWGYQEGKKRNSRVQNINQPVVMLRNDWALSDKLALTTSLGFQTGRTGNTALDWYNAPDPRPNYYRRLPSYFEGDTRTEIEQLWEDNPEIIGQIDWDQIYQANYNGFQTIENADGIAGNTVSGLRSQYVIEDRRTDLSRATANTVLEAFLSDHLTMQFGLTYSDQTTANYKLVDDLLGGDFYLNVDKFAEFDSSGIFTENNLAVPNEILREGDRFGYDYDLHIQQTNAWTQANFRFPKVDFFLAGSIGQSKYWRDGKVANGKFPDSSFGESEKLSFTEVGAKGGLTYKINGRNYLLVNAAYQTKAPYTQDAFTSPRTRNQVVSNLTEEKILSLEGGYLLRSPKFKARAMGYLTRFEDQIFNRSLFLDRVVQNAAGTSGGFVNYIMQGINSQHAGLELAVEVNVTPALRATAVAAIGQYIYTNRPTATIYLDQLAEEVVKHTVYIDNYNVAGSANEAYTFGLNYTGSNFWFANLNFNYFAGTWLDFFPERRTTEAVSYVSDPTIIQEVVTPDSELWNSILDQERTPSAFTMDFFGGKSWKINNVFLLLNVGVNNLLDKKDFRTGGYEQFRFDFDTKDVNRFPNNYFYSFGRNYFVSLTFRM